MKRLETMFDLACVLQLLQREEKIEIFRNPSTGCVVVNVVKEKRTDTSYSRQTIVSVETLSFSDAINEAFCAIDKE